MHVFHLFIVQSDIYYINQNNIITGQTLDF